jgi:hypothetical protein
MSSKDDKEKDEDSSNWRYAGLEEQWDSFDRKIMRYMRKKFDRFGEDMWMGFIPNIDTLQGEAYGLYCERVYRAIEINNATKAWSLWTHDSGFWGRDWQKDWITREYNLLLDYIEDHCDGQAQLEVVNYTGSKSEIRKHLYKQFGAGTGGDIHTKELDFDNGMPESGKEAFYPGMDLTVKLRELEARRLYFWKMCKPEKRSTYLYCQESKLVRIVLDKINSDYDDCISRLLDYVKMTKLIQSSSVGGEMDAEGIPDLHDRSFNDDWLPSWKLLQACLIAEYKKLLNSGKLAKVSHGRTSDKLPVAAIGLKEIKCFACGGPHKKGDPACKAGPYDIHPCAPENFKNRQLAKKRKAETGTNMNAPSNKKTKVGDNKSKPCFDFAKGYCQYGAKCRFSHDPALRKSTSNSVMLTTEQEEMVRTMVASAIKQTSQSMNRRNKNANKRQKKREKNSDKGSETPVIISALLTPSSKSIPRWPMQSNTTCLTIKLHDVDKNIGIDSDAAISISCFREDFLWIDESPQAKSSMSPTGVGGGGKVAGIGPMIARAHSGEYILDPNGVYLARDDDQPIFRLFSTQRLKALGVRMVQCFDGTEVDVIQDRRTGKTVSLSEDGPKDKTILVLSTVQIPRIEITPCIRRLVKEIQNGRKTAMLEDLSAIDNLSGTLIAASSDTTKSLVSSLATPYHETPIMAFNIAKCTIEERSRLFVRRFGCCDSNLLVRMSSDPDFGDVPKLCALNEDNVLKDAAKFRKQSHTRIDPEISQRLPTWWRVYADAYGGGQSMGVESYEGAIGGYLFKCPSSGEIVHKLYSSHEQFPAAVFQFLVQVEAEGHRCHEIYVDTHSVNLSHEVEEVVALFQCRIVPVSAGTPQEVAFVETAHRVIAARSRAMMLGAPHLPKWVWALADKHAVFVGRFLPQSTRNWKCSYYLNTGRHPPWRFLCLHVFGAPCRYAPMTGPVHKRAELTCEGYYVGVQHPMALVLRKHDMKLISCSTKKIAVYESPYTAPLFMAPPLSPDANAQSEPDLVDASSSLAVPEKGKANKFSPESANQDSTMNYVPKNSETSHDDVSKNVRVGNLTNGYEQSPDDVSRIPNIANSSNSIGNLSAITEKSFGRDQRTNAEIEKLDNVNPATSVLPPPSIDSAVVPPKSSSGVKTTGNVRTQRPRSVQSIKSVSSHNISPPTSKIKLFRGPTILDSSADTQTLNQGEGDVVPEHLSYDVDLSAGIEAMIKEARKISDPKIRDRVVKALSSSADEVQMVRQPKQLKKGKAVHDKIDVGNVIKGKRDRRKIFTLKANSTEASKKSSQVFPLRMGDAVSADPAIFDAANSGSLCVKYPGRRLGTVIKTWKGYDTVEVEWLDGTKSQQKIIDLRMEKPKTTAAMILAAMFVGSFNKAEDHMNKANWPKDFYHALVHPEWRHWVAAVKKEIDSWLAFNAYTEIPFSQKTAGASIVPLGELFTRKRDESFKFRQYLMGHLLQKGKDYEETFSSCISWDGIRWCASVACAMSKEIKGLDAVTGFLQAREQFDLYAFLPSHAKYSSMSFEELAKVRQNLLDLVSKEGPQGLKKFAAEQKRMTRTNPETCYKLNSCIYGAPSANHEWDMLFQHAHVNVCGLTLSEVEPSLYVRLETDGNDNVKEWLIAKIWTDDVRYFGTDKLVADYEAKIAKAVKVKFLGAPGEFVGTEFIQNLDLGLCELKAPKYWEGALLKFEKLFKDGVPERFNPLSEYDEKQMEEPVTDEEAEEAKNLPYRELLGVVSYPAACCKLEMRYSISICGRHRGKWGKKQFRILKRVFEYGYTTRHTGIIFSRGLDKHGINQLYCYADSAHSLPRSYGCTVTMMNGGVLSLSAKKHTITASSTCHDELIEFWIAANKVSGFRNIMEEMGLAQQLPTVVYQDNESAIQIEMNRGSLTNQSRHIERKVLSARNKIEDGLVRPEYVNTSDMYADIGTKALPDKQFAKLRDGLTGYSLVKAHHPEYQLPTYVV